MFRNLEDASRTTEIRETEWVPAYLAGGVAPSLLWAELRDVEVAPLGQKEIQRTVLCTNAIDATRWSLISVGRRRGPRPDPSCRPSLRV